MLRTSLCFLLKCAHNCETYSAGDDNTLQVRGVIKKELSVLETFPLVETIEIEKNAIDNLQEHQLVSFYNTRYPVDTITNPLPIAQPVLVSAAKDLVELDGAKQIIVLKNGKLH